MELGADLGGAVEKIRELQRTRLRRYREDAGFTQGQVAERLGVSQQAVAKWEASNDPPVDVWPRMAVLYGIAENNPQAPFNPEKRRVWMEARSGGFASVGARDAPSRKKVGEQGS